MRRRGTARRAGVLKTLGEFFVSWCLGVLVVQTLLWSAELFLEPYGLELGDEGLEHQIQIPFENLPEAVDGE